MDSGKLAPWTNKQRRAPLSLVKPLSKNTRLARLEPSKNVYTLSLLPTLMARGTGVRETEWHDSSGREAEFHVLSLDTFSNEKTVFVTIQATSKDNQ